MFKYPLILALAVSTLPALAQDANISIENGMRISVIGGCHDCHSLNYAETAGTIDPATALKGSPVGYQGPWGTTYAVNLRLVAASMTEEAWVKYLSTLEARPPMPWFNVQHMTETETRSLYQYIVSLGAPGDPAPKALPPGEAPMTPFLVFAPPTMPAG